LDKDFPFTHFGVGLAAGATTLPKNAINPLLVALGEKPLDGLAIPFAVVNARIGGFFLPFDIGLKVGFLPDSLASAAPGYTFTYQNFGLDFRYNLVKSDLAL